MNMLKNMESMQNLSPSQNIFYRAVVENNNDGGVHGKCQVRILGIHPTNAERTGKNKGVPVCELPWAELVNAADGGGGVSGYGVSSVPLKGTWVWVFLDSGDWNKPIIIGIIKGTSNMLTPGALKDQGFHDPDGVYPKADRLSEGDINRISANRKVGETLITTVKAANIDTGIPMAKGGTWDELPEQTSSASYPCNHTHESISGNFMENDDTGLTGRMHWFHHTGTYWEVVASGDYTMKVVNNCFKIVDIDNFELIKGNETRTIFGSGEYKIDGDKFTVIGGTMKEYVTGKVTEVYYAGQFTNGGPEIRLRAGMIYLN